MDRAKAAEDEYFRREEADKRLEEAFATERATQVERDRKAAFEAKRCPKCRTRLGADTLRGKRVDRCLSCGGVWIEAEALAALTRPSPEIFERLRRFFSGRRSPPPAEG